MGDHGTEIVLVITDPSSIADPVLSCDPPPLDLTGATTKDLFFLKPDGTGEAKAATFETDGSDGVIKYVAEVGFFDQHGGWEVEARIASPTGSWKSGPACFRVYPGLGE